MISDEQKTAIIERVKAMLDDPSCEIATSRGKRDVTEHGDTNRRYEPSGGAELLIKVQGGAVEVPNADPLLREPEWADDIRRRRPLR